MKIRVLVKVFQQNSLIGLRDLQKVEEIKKINQVAKIFDKNRNTNKQMHTDPNYLRGRKKLIVSDIEAQELYNKGKKFQADFQQMQLEFKQSRDIVYYIVSTKFISEWKDFCFSTDTSRLSPHAMNYDLYDNGQLKTGLVEKADFQLVSETVYNLFTPFTDETQLNKREAVFIGDQKRVPIYLITFKYIFTTYQILKDIDFKKLNLKDFQPKSVKISESSTLQHFLTIIRDQQQLSQKLQLRLWLPEKQLTPQQLYYLIQKELKPCSVSTYKVQGVGKRLENLDAKLSEVVTEDDNYFVVESKKQEDRFIFVKDNEGRCEGCNHFGILEFPCGCNKVKYCSQKCLEKDKAYHAKSCPYAEEMELNKKIDMKKSPKNLHGLVGLNNLGNTCFMNSCLQCLSNTVPLTNYFIQEFFESEINKTNKIGFKGKLAKNYAKFIKAMWCDQDDSFAPYSVKNAVSDINPMFSGYAQHDSQQFFSFLVDGLHEDLNRVEVKPYVPSVQEDSKTEIELAKQSWAAHLKRNQSIITDLMSGQYRSIVTCPDCQHKSTTFDPFTTVSLTIPQTTESVIEFFMIHNNMQKKTKRGWFKYTTNDASEWNRKACEAVGADLSRCCLYAVSAKENIYRVGRQSMAQIAHKVEAEGKNLFLMEMSDQEMSIPKENVVQFTVRMSKTAYYRTDDLFFKIPMFFDKENFTGLSFYKRILKFLYSQAYDNSKNRKSFLNWGGKEYQEYEREMLKRRPFKAFLRVDKKLEKSYSKTEVEFKKQIELEDGTSIIDLLQRHQFRPDECELDARFEKGKIDDYSFEKLKDFDNVGKQPKPDKECSEIGLEKCLKSFSQPEILQAGNEWYCPKCKEHKLAQKQLSIYRAPKVLILHLKRFKQKGAFKKQKNDTLIRFPNQLDLGPYVIDSKPMQAYKEEIDRQVYITPKAQNIPFIMSNTKSKPVYELYAISNHYGGLGGGHYTAFGKNEGQWYEFDDSRVSNANKKEIVSPSAYILFYERKQ